MRKPFIHLKNLSIGLILAYALACAFMWGYQRHLLYVPMKGIEAPDAYGLQDFAALRLTSQDGTRLAAWYRQAAAGYPTIVYFHGNGGNLGTRARYFRLLSDGGFGVLGLDYRGYGGSEGSPSEDGFYQDARAVMAYATGTLALPPRLLVVYGESLGTGVAVQIAGEYPVAALVLQSPFASAEAVAAGDYPWLPVGLLMRDRYDSLSKIARVHAPLLLFHGEQDAIVPAAQARRLFAGASQPKQAIYYPDRGHNDLDLEALKATLIDFCRRQRLIPAD